MTKTIFIRDAFYWFKEPPHPVTDTDHILCHGPFPTQEEADADRVKNGPAADGTLVTLQ